MYLNTHIFPTTGYARVLLFMFIRRELGGTGTGCLFQFTYCVDCRRLMFCLYSLRYTCVFKIHVRTYFEQSILTDQIHLQQCETLIFHDMATLRLQVYNFGVESVTDG